MPKENERILIQFCAKITNAEEKSIECKRIIFSLNFRVGKGFCMSHLFCLPGKVGKRRRGRKIGRHLFLVQH